MSDPFRFDDAPYVFGALDAAEREAFEAHLATCPDCRARVAEARKNAMLLAGLTHADVADPEPVPDTMLPRLLRAAAAERARRRWLTGSLGAIAAAGVAALVVLLWPASGHSGNAPSVALSAVRPTPVTATARLVSKSWGTEIDLHCRYDASVDEYAPYRLLVIDKEHTSHPAGSWTLAPDRTTNFVGGTAVPRDEIAKVEITLADGTPILQLTA